MEKLLDQIKAVAEEADEQTRRAITESLRRLSISLEDSEDTVERIAFAPLQLFAAKIGVDLQIFRRLAAVGSSIGLETLAHETKADVLLLGRLLRYWASISMITEIDVDTFAANNITKVLASSKGESYIRVYYELVSPVFYELPKFLEKTGYVNPTNPSELPLQDAYGFDGDMFAYFKTFPQKQALFNTHMELQRNLITNWGTLCSLIRSRQLVPGEVLFVDVGGGTGHQSRRIRAELPDIPGEMILQDLPQVIANVGPIPGVTKMNYDIFTPQPVRGACFYYFRGVLHDFPDTKCKVILQNTVASMGPRSTILIEEMVLPDKSINWQSAGLDLQMMANLGSQERTRKHWIELLRSVGLQVMDTQYYGLDAYQGVIIAERSNRVESGSEG